MRNEVVAALPPGVPEFPTVRLGHFPTPLQAVPRLASQVGHERLYIKRDDLTGLSLGGNKTRSLEFLLGDASSRGSDIVISAGGLQSNLCSLTAAACSKAGLECILLHNDVEPVQREGNMLLNALFGAKSLFLGKVSEEARSSAMETLAAQLRETGRRPYLIMNGASTPYGGLGYVSAAAELKLQSDEMNAGVKHVAMVGAMGGTASGFIYGTAMLGRPFHVHVISVEYPKDVLLGLIDELVSGIVNLTGVEPSVPFREVFTIHDEYLGDGYAKPTTLSRETLHVVPQLEGILLEDVYTSKTLGGFLDLIRRGIVPKNEAACYIHTGGMGSLFAQHL